MKIKEIKEKIALHLKERRFRVSIFGSNPYSDWIVIIMIFFGLFGLSAVGSYFYYQNALENINNLEIKQEFNKELEYGGATSFIENYEMRQNNFERYLNDRE